MAQEREYIITLKPDQDWDLFYEDMESNYGDAEIPHRQVECAYRRPMSRSTHYYLTDDEAAQVAQDSRVESVTLTYQDRGLSISSFVVQTSANWDKSSTNNSSDVNWGLLRGYERATRASWGSDGTTAVSGTIDLGNIGRNVDVVIIDGHMVPGHPEWAVNADGTGGTRLNQFNWFQYNQQVRATAAGTYVYDFISGTQPDADNNHGNNVGAIAVGNTCGWARGANIYNISPYSSSTANATGYGNYIYDLMNYIRVWHNSKAINPATGRRNPTICNMSWGLTSQIALASIDRVIYQGVTYNKPGGGWTATDRANFGLVAASGSNMLFMARDSSIDADMVDAINDGIILVGAAGNFYMYFDRIGGINYDNALQYLSGTYQSLYYMRGSSPGAAPGVVTVSAIDATVAERKADFSNAGPRTDIFASGSNIMGVYYTGGVTDPRNASFRKGKMSGTSQASPQVCGLLACALETYPNMTAAQALQYIRTNSTANGLQDSAFSTTYGSSSYLSYNTLYGGPNLYAAYRNEAARTNQVYPRRDYFVRPTAGRAFPRQKIRRYG
jgi:hypothetical protein